MKCKKSAIILILLAGCLLIYLMVADYLATENTNNLAIKEADSEAKGDTRNIIYENSTTTGGLDPSVAPPSLELPAIFPENMPVSTREKIVTGMKKDIENIKKADPMTYSSWISLGNYRSELEDYSGAKKVWEYLISVRPKSVVPYINLANLYGYHFQNPDMAIKMFLGAAENDTTYFDSYLQLYEYYLYVLNQPEKAKEVIKMAIDKNPGNTELLKFYNSI